MCFHLYLIAVLICLCYDGVDVFPKCSDVLSEGSDMFLMVLMFFLMVLMFLMALMFSDQLVICL